MKGRTKTTVTIDGVTFALTQVLPDTALRLQAMLFRILSEPVAGLLAETGALAGLAVRHQRVFTELVGTVLAATEGVDESDAAQIAAAEAEVRAALDDASPLLDLIRSLLEALPEKLDPDDLVRISHMLLIGSAAAQIQPGQFMPITTRDEYDEIMQAVGPWSRLRLIKAAVVHNFRPTGAAVPTSASTPAETAASSHPHPN